MSTAEELLATTLTDEPHIVIDSNRAVTVPESLKFIAVQFDHNIETVTFDCPRYWDGNDLSTMKVCINYMRPDKKVGQYQAKNVVIDTENPDIFHFDWTIDGYVTEVTGNLAFLVCAAVTNEEGELINRWSSLLNMSMSIQQGLNASNEIGKLFPDVIADILARLDAAERGDIALDTTLSVSGKAADAKAVGDAIKGIKIEVDPTLSMEGMAADAKAVGDKIADIPSEDSIIDKVMARIPETPIITKVDFSNFTNGSWTETAGDVESQHSVRFDTGGRPVMIDDIEINWGE